MYLISQICQDWTATELITHKTSKNQYKVRHTFVIDIKLKHETFMLLNYCFLILTVFSRQSQKSNLIVKNSF